ncbi:unnamed protein product [Strongylus vulgaris]|uniref:acid phosphatase n=1 Tax=Strongylus vulgaris TaxID=40348 RepID=A0A3P7KYN3_STRVU|nr:unnamed protein product [Strongylus vulgaris]
MSGVGAYHNPIWIQTRSGKLLWTIARNLEEAIGNNSTSRKFLAYSTHDVTIAALLDSMGVLKLALAPLGRPAFTAAVIFELWKTEKREPYLKVLFRRGSGFDKYIDLTTEVRGCNKTQFCPVDSFLEAMNEYENDDPEALCQVC